MLAPGKTGLGFAVGQEPLSALFATYRVNILATDLFSEQAMARGWVETDQHADGYAAMNKKGICDEALLRERVKFTFADMNNIGREWDNSFDFVWSACALEHLGSLEHGTQFIINAMHCLKPGGVAVHTTEFNVSSNFATVATGETVLYRRRDIQELEKRLKEAGHRIELDFSAGTTNADKFVDVPPYAHATHLKLQIGKFVATSIGLIVQKAQ